MDSLNKGSRLSRQGSRIRRQRSKEWQDYSSSDNEDDQQYRYTSEQTVDYEENRVTSDSRKHDRGRGRGNNNTSSGRSYNHSSMELLTARNYGGYSGSEGEVDPSLVSGKKTMQYPAYGTLPRPPHSATGSTTWDASPLPRDNPGSAGNGPRNRISLSLRRGPSSSSTSDNNSDGTYTDSEFVSRNRGGGKCQNGFPDSPPEPAPPPAVPPRSVHSVHHIDTTLGRRPRLGYLESECESEPPYLPTMLSGAFTSYASEDLPSVTQTVTLVANPGSVSIIEESEELKKLNRKDGERLYGQQVQIPDALNNASKSVTIATSSNNPVSNSSEGPTYSNPLPVFCNTPSSTTGPMVPVTNCVNPQLIQAPTAPCTSRPHFSTSAFSASVISPSRFHLRKSCLHKCSWKWATIVLICVTIVMTATMTYFAAMNSLNITPETSKPCIVVDSVESATRYPATISPNTGSFPQPACLILPREITVYQEIQIGPLNNRKLRPQQTWNLWFVQQEAMFVRFNFSVGHGARLALLARRSDPPSITNYDFMEVVGEDRRRYKRATLAQDEISFLHYLQEGNWYLSLINDHHNQVSIAFHLSLAREVPTTCPSNCHQHGNCHLGKCHCFPGYIGPDCADSVCPVLCSGHGKYIQGTCKCETGWKGPECNIQSNECEVPDCLNHGRCVDGLCLCQPGYKGINCEQVDCVDPLCSGHGVCVEGKCWCKTGWIGKNCSEADDRLSRCFSDCSQHGVYDLEVERCVCFEHWTGSDCSKAKCSLDCGKHGKCEEGRCSCEQGWTGTKCDEKLCDQRCLDHGQCNNGTCICIEGWTGKYCTLESCPNGCSNRGQCLPTGCTCQADFGGKDCSIRLETNCADDKDNDGDGLVDCADSECCNNAQCQDSLMCVSSPDPLDILLRKQPPAVTASFYHKMKFLIEEDSVQSYSHRDEYSESRVAVLRGQVLNREGSGIMGIRVSVATDPQFGFTLTRADGWFDILVNGGGAVTLQFQRNPFHPIKRTILAPWNEIVVMKPVVMSALVDTLPESEKDDHQEPCHVHDYDTMKPIVYQTWKPVSQGGCTDCSAILAETQVLQETLSIPGSDLHLVYHSSHAQGYLSTIHLQLTSSTIPKSLKLVYLKIIVDGILFEKIFEADPDIKYTYAWNKRNIYKQKVYGLTTAKVFVGYEYLECEKVMWTAHVTTLRGYDMDISELGGWNLDIHHRYNFHEGVMQKGDGTTIYFRQQPRVISILMGTGEQRSLLCLDCNGLARESKLLAPVALTSGPDGSVYVGDYNLVRRVTPTGQVYTVFRMRTAEMSAQYHLTLSPTDGHLYISDPERHRILRIHSLDKVDDPDSNFDVVVGSGERCLPRDKDNCGDEKPALEARLSYPKGMAVAVDNTLYFADGPNIRMVDSRGVIHTLIGDHQYKKQWRPMPCSGTLTVSEAKLRWPTDLAISPLDGCLYFIDDHMVLKLTKDKRIMVVAGHPVYCKTQDETDQRPRVTGDSALRSLVSFAFGPTGIMYIVEVDDRNVYRIRTLTADGDLAHFAGREDSCDCQWQNCTCVTGKEEGMLAVDTRLISVTSVTVTFDNVVHIADQGSLRILSAVPYLPPPDEQMQYQIAYPDHHELYVFNKYGQHVSTINILTGKSIYTFLYNVNTSFGKLSAITDTSGNKISFLRDAGNDLQTIETARGQKCRIEVTKQNFLTTFVDPNNSENVLEYDSVGLLVRKSDTSGNIFFYLYDNNGRLTTIVKPTGRVTSLTFDLSSVGATVSSRDSERNLEVTVRGTKVISEQGGSHVLQTTLHKDGTIEVETPWNQAVVWEATNHQVLQDSMPVQAGMFPLPTRQKTFFGMEQTSVTEWNYGIKYGKKDGHRSVTAVERILMVNNSQYLSVEYDWIASREIFYNSSRRPFLVVQYDNLGRPAQWLPTDTRLPVNIMYERLGHLSGWQQGTLAETFGYDRMGHLSEIKYPDNASNRMTYEGKTMPSKIVLPSGRKYTYHYDEHGGLRYVTTPRGTRHIFAAYTAIGVRKFSYTPPGNKATYSVHFNDLRLPVLKVHPGDYGRVLYRYTNHSLLSAVIYGGGEVRKTYTSSGQISSEFWSANGINIVTEYKYEGILLTESKTTVHGSPLLAKANFRYKYDSLNRITSIIPQVADIQLPNLEFLYNGTTGKLEHISPFHISEISLNGTVFSDGTVSYIRHADSIRRIHQVSLVISDKEVYGIDVKYNARNNVILSRIYMRHLGTSMVRVQNFTYDQDGQLVEMMGRDQWKFTYDENGNMVTMQYMGNQIDIVHDLGDRIVSFGETPYLLDTRGFVVQRGEEVLLYNTRGQLIRATRSGRYDVQYYYDANSRLSGRKDSFGNVTQYFYSHPNYPSLLTHAYNNADGRIITITYDDRLFPVYIRLNRESYYVATDHIGSPLLVFDVYGDVVKEIHRGPYGHVLFDSNPNFYLPVDFQGGLLDPVTGLVHFGDRIYDSLVGQWMTPRWEDMLRHLSDPKGLHLYRFNKNDPVNLPMNFKKKLDLNEWIKIQGIDMSSLDLGAEKLFEDDPKADPPPLYMDVPSITTISGITCSIRQKLKTFASISSVQKPRVKLEQLFEKPKPRISTERIPFGRGIMVTKREGRVLVHATSEADAISKDVFVSVFNNSYLLDIQFLHHGRDVYYFVKESTWGVVDDINQLQRLGSAANATVHEIKADDQQGNHVGDVKVHLHHAIINVRYGTTPEREHQRLLKHAKQRAVSQRWAQEKEHLISNPRSPSRWNEEEKSLLINTGSISHYRDRYYHDPLVYPELSDDPWNIVFEKSASGRRR
ncbi:teneurin-m-like isoform X2 [Centruroides vittatus]|uniref:teneurin-m-like isoform X2 n=1 Tax=Centruroides vittatus TaxID=120091 RepID=UPI00350F9B1F